MEVFPMKKALALLLALCLCFGLLAACATEKKAEEEPTATDPTAPTEAPQFDVSPAEDDTLNILFIGHSFSYYYTNELYGMLQAAGIKARICNLYYSGCLLEKHYEWLQTDAANYQDFITIDENGRVATGEGISLREAIATQNWDVISLQPGIDFYNRTAAQMLTDTQEARTGLINFLKQKFPEANMYWHQFWAFQEGFVRDDYTVDNPNKQDIYYKEALYFAKVTCEEFDLERVNTGYAWQLVRQTGYDNLCDRLTGNDKYHDGDIGGGQYLNACVWFEYLTGQSCINNTWRPDDCTYGEGAAYTLSEEMITLLQEKAHTAVADRDFE